MAAVLRFGGRYLDELYNQTGSRNDVFTYLDSVISNAAELNPPISEATKKELVDIRDQIELLSLPKGVEYVGEDMDPERQHIRRQLDPAWAADTRKVSKKEKEGMAKFEVWAEESKHDWAVYTNDSKRLYWNQYDLLGLFFSKMGPAPGGPVADQSNFYLPLTAVYGKFCRWIGGKLEPAMESDTPDTDKKAEGCGDPPFCVQSTWRKDTGAFFLGASLAGVRANGTSTPYGVWGDRVMEKRWDLLNGLLGFPGDWGEFKDKKSPTIAYQKKKTLFGNCGETYPFLEMIGPHVQDDNVRARTHGLALSKDFAKVATYNEEALSRTLIPPCLNCQLLLLFAGVTDVNQFTLNSRMTTPLFPTPVAGYYEPEDDN